MWTAAAPAAPAELARVLLRPLENPERSVVSSPLPDRLLQPRDRLDVVVQDVRPGRHHRPERLRLAVEVGDQDLDAHARARVPQPPDRLGEDARPPSARSSRATLVTTT